MSFPREDFRKDHVPFVDPTDARKLARGRPFFPGREQQPDRLWSVLERDDARTRVDDRN
jgi:hypothetical protein